MSRSYKITIVGAGNVAWHLASALEDAGHSIQEVYSRNKANAIKLAEKLYDAYPTDDLDFTESLSRLFLVCVSDDAIEGVLEDLRIPDDAVIAHTSGTKPMEIFELLYLNKGVFYPLQTFSKQRKVNFSEIPVCLEADSEVTQKLLTEVALSITPEIYFLGSQQRKVLHISAVFACNFTNHLLAISKEILEKAGLDYGMLNPLISETINKALDLDPKKSQTGPAIRKDVKVLQEHMNYLREDPDKKLIYRILSESILKMGKE